MFTRSEHNPIITAADLPFSANSVFNPGAVVLRDGQIGLLLRVEDRRGLSSIHVARSHDGFTNWLIDPRPLLAPDPEHLSWEWGFEDARVSFVHALDRFVITCTAYGRPGPCVYLTFSDDLETTHDGAVVITPEDKNASLFPRRIGDQWLLLHRPVVMASNSADVWISRSDDLSSWKSPEPMLLRRPGGWWDAARIGIGPPPIETAEGWVQIYHGVRNTMSGAIYRVGVALLDLDRPWKVRRRLANWILSPTDPWERAGDVGNVVFPCGAIHRADTGTIDLYYGAADTVVCTARAKMSDVLEALLSEDDLELDATQPLSRPS